MVIKKWDCFYLILGVDYELFCMDDDFDSEVFKAMTAKINIKDFNPKYFGKYKNY